ncbi:hypothetical protein JTB14_014951 [Gonioctena quinquepunctata]|nr:hypothetical protein JTB14_014951 [Gonioctena quinquepunctata]
MESTYNLRIKRVLDKIVEPNFKLKNDAYLNLLLTHLTTVTTDDGQVATQNEANKQFFVDWMVDLIMKWTRTNDTPNPNVLAFTINLLRSFCCDEETFIKLNNAYVFEKLLNISKSATNVSPQPNVELALIKLISCMDHETGLQWIISTKCWEMVLNSTLNSHTVYITKEGRKCISKLLIKVAPTNIPLCKNIIQIILTPLVELSNKVTESYITLETIDDSSYTFLLPTLQLIDEMLVTSLQDQMSSKEKEIIFNIVEEFALEKHVHNLTSSIKNDDFRFNLYQILVISSFFEIYQKCCTKKIIHFGQGNIPLKFFDWLYDAASEGTVTTVMKLTYTSLKNWQIVKNAAGSCFTPKLIELSFEGQVMAVQLLPASTFGIGMMRTCIIEPEEDVSRSQFMQKFIDHIVPTTLRILYKCRPHVNQNYSLAHGIMALKYFLHSRNYYTRENAILALQWFTYTLMDIVDFLKSRSDLTIHFLKQPEYLSLILEAIAVIIEEFAVTWKDSTEIFCILQVVYDFLNVFAWPSKIVVNGLKLADKSISKYMSPQMALLIDNVDDSIIKPFASMLYTKLHDGEWEVRDSAIELILTMAKTANTKFSSFRKPISENDFPCVILNMALVDGSSFVKATALKCLQEMIQAPEFWHILCTKGNILEKTINILHAETEGIVRTEAATLIDFIYRNQSIPENSLDKLYDVMTHAVVADLHWEVRVKALNFWKSVIDHHLTQQGMIDGSFPPFTFSKEHRKIVNLDEDEIKKGLVKVMHQLSLNGCLSVFHMALQDQCDLEVSKYATTTICDFVTLLKKYKITSGDVASSTEPTNTIHSEDVLGSQASSFSLSDTSDMSMDGVVQNAPMENTDQTMEDLLEDILNSRDINLLQSVFNTLDEPSSDFIKAQNRKVLPPKDFINLIYSNFEFYTKEKVDWVKGIDNFDSLLDDILKEYDTSDVNSMDCY